MEKSQNEGVTNVWLMTGHLLGLWNKELPEPSVGFLSTANGEGERCDDPVSQN